MERLRLTKLAQADIRHIWDHIAFKCQNPTAADKQIKRLFDRCRLLATQPQLGERRDDLRTGIRTFSAGSYVILYIPSEDRIEVVGIVHGAQDLEGIFLRGER